jgi:hypothetical protein
MPRSCPNLDGPLQPGRGQKSMQPYAGSQVGRSGLPRSTRPQTDEQMHTSSSPVPKVSGLPHSASQGPAEDRRLSSGMHHPVLGSTSPSSDRHASPSGHQTVYANGCPGTGENEMVPDASAAGPLSSSSPVIDAESSVTV